jgi:hypothetical protein
MGARSKLDFQGGRTGLPSERVVFNGGDIILDGGDIDINEPPLSRDLRRTYLP